ncbi:hypothetical protein ABW19_dt0202593 [Dactylella cylindrospora]|nr:hypothetical protein ABW19_dt0202593 [Dactylella cylindrospora]
MPPKRTSRPREATKATRKPYERMKSKSPGRRSQEAEEEGSPKPRASDVPKARDESPVGTLVHSFGDGKYEIYEADGANPDHQAFLQRMCLFGKFFIQNKSIWYEFDNFLFYILVEKTSPDQKGKQKLNTKFKEEGDEIHSHNGDTFSYCGFFSKEKTSYDDNNLSCIILYPPYRSQGLGGALIDFSYHVTKMMGKVGGPEKPISELGKRGYIGYWTRAIAGAILAKTSPRVSKNRVTKPGQNRKKAKGKVASRKLDSISAPVQAAEIANSKSVTIDSISRSTGINPEDILEALVYMDVVKYDKGQPVVSRRRLREWEKGGKGRS